jgi:hypothetical protein
MYVATYLNTDNGLYQFTNSDGFQIDPSFSARLGGSRDIRGSGSFPVPGTDIDYAVFFRRNGGLGGTYVPSAYSSDPSQWSWVNIDMAGVTDMTVSYYNAYYAADGEVFALSPAYLQEPALAENRTYLPAPAPVLSVGFKPSGVAPGGTLYLGTTDGVWQMQVDESTTAPIASVPSAPTQIPGTAGDRIERIAINTSTGYHEAYLSRYYLYIVKSGFLYDRIPFFAMVPGRATGMAWDSNWNLYIAGSEGLAALYTGS